MDWGMILASVGLSLVLTVFGYLLIPTILALAGKKYEAKKLKRINIINCVVVWILFRILQIALGDDPSSGAAVFLWGAVGHWILKKYCLKDKNPTSAPAPTPITQTPQVRVCLSDKDEVPRKYGNYNVYGSDIALKQDTEQPKVDPVLQVPQPKAQPIQTQPPVVKQAVKYCSRCGKVIDPVTKKCRGCGKQYFKGISAKTVCIILLSILFAASFAGNIILCVANITMREEFDALSKTNASLKTEVAELKKDVAEYKDDVADLESDNNYYYEYWYDNNNKVDLLDSWIVFVENDGSNLYHKYECNKFVGNDCWAHNVEYAEYIGYNPCPLCCN